METLEDRLAPALVTWTGAGGNNLWNNPANWDVGVPTATDDVVIPDVAATTEVQVNVNATVLSLVSAERLTITSTTLTINGPGASTLSGGLTFSGGTIAGAGPLTVSGTSTWTGGTISHTNFTNAGTMSIGSAGNRTISGIFNNSGTFNHSTSGNLDLSAAASRFNNLAGGLYNFQTDGDFQGNGAAIFTNTGTVRKSAGTGETTTAGIALVNQTGGLVEVQTGTLIVPENEMAGGAFAISSGATVRQTGAITWTGTNTITGAGSFRLEANLTIAAGSATTFNMTGVGFNHVSGIIGPVGGTGQIINDGVATWTAGSIDFAGYVNNGTLTVPGGGVRTLRGTLTNNGTVLHTGTSGMSFFEATSRFINNTGATYEMSSTGGVTGSNGLVVNQGTIRKTGTGTINNFAPIQQAGLLEVQGGTISTNALNLNGGTTTIDAGAVLNQVGISTWGGTNSISGAGTLGVSNNTTVTAGSQTTVNMTGSFNHTSGIFGPVGGLGQVINNGTASWSGGSIDIAGYVNNGTMSLPGAGTKTLRGTLTNNGTVLHTGTGGVSLFEGTSRFINAAGGTYDMQSTGVISGSSGQIHNDGTILKSSTGSSALNPTILNSGTLNIQAGSINATNMLRNSGTITLAGGTTLTSNGDFDSVSGTYQIAAGATIIYNGGGTTKSDWSGTTVVSGDGTFRMQALGEINALLGSTVTFNLPVGGLVQTGSALNGAGSFVVNGPYSWTGGFNGATGGVTVNGPLTIGGGSPLTRIQQGGILNIAGTATSAGNIELEGARLNVLPGATFTIGADHDFLAVGAASTSRVTNSGTMRKTGGTTNDTDFNIPVVNQGTIEVLAGRMDFTFGYSQTSGSLILNGGNAASNNAFVPDFQGGTLGGTGTWTGNIKNSGATLAPGLSPGTFTIAGAYTQTAPATLALEFAGTAVGQADRLVVTGAASLGGNLALSVIGSYAPAAGDTFTSLTYASLTGGFANVTGNVINPALAFAITPTTTATTITVAPGSDLRVDSVGIPSSAEPGKNVTINYTVVNDFNATTAGSWTDSIFLSRDNILDASDILIGRVTRTGDVAAGASYNGTLTTVMPAALPGNYRILVSADSSRLSADINPFNNLGVSTGFVNVDVPVLDLDQPFNGTIKNGELQFYRLNIPAGEDALVTLNQATAGSAELIVRYLQMPTRTEFDQKSFNPASTIERVIWSSPQTGAYFILLAGQGNAGTGKAFTLTATQTGFSLLDIVQGTTADMSSGAVLGTPGTATGSNAGSTTVTLIGTGLTPNTTVQLTGPGGVRTATAVRYQGQNRLLVTFNLTGLPTGTYNVVATNENGTATLPNSFIVTTGNPGQLSVQISAPSSIREDNFGTVTVTVRNTGATDIPAPLLFMRTTNARIKLREQSTFTDQILPFLGANTNGLPGVLPAGFVGTITFDFQNISGATTTNSTFDVDIADPAEPIDWLALKASLKPATTPDAAYEIIFANFLSQVGTTAGDYANLLRDNANYLAQLGEYTFDVGKLLAFEILQADDFGQITKRFTPGIFGIGHPDPITQSAIVNPDGSVTILRQNISRVFLPTPGGFVGQPGDTGTLTRLSDGSHQLRELSGDITTFRPDGRFDFAQDRNGYRFTASYTGSLLTALTETNGDVTSFEYDGQGRVTRMINPVSDTIDYTYDPVSGRLSSITDLNGTTTFTYHTGRGPAIDGAIKTITDPAGVTVSFEYDSRGRVIRYGKSDTQQFITHTYDSAGGFTMTDAVGNTTRIFRNDRTTVARIVGAAGQIVSMQYDGNGDITKTNLPGTVAFTTTYNAQGLVTSMTDPIGNQFLRTYQTGTDNLLAFTTPKGQQYTRTYDAAGNLASRTYPDGTVELMSYDARGNLVEFTNRRGETTHVTYNAKDLVERIDRPNGLSETFTYNARRNVTSITDATGTTTYTYDVLGRLTQITMPTGKSVSFVYDSAGRRLQVSDGDGHTTAYSYNALGMLDRVTDDIGTLIESYQYDPVGRMIRVERGNGTATNYAYTPMGQIAAIVQFGPGGVERERVEYTYDLLGNRASETGPDGTTSYEHDALGRIIRAVLPNGTDIRYEYDAMGNRTAVTTNGVVVAYTTNDLEQYTSRGSTSYSYDASGNLITKTDASGTTTYEYDEENRLTRVVEPGGAVTEYLYNALNQRVAEIHNGVRMDYLIDPLGFGNVVAMYSNGNLVSRYAYGQGLVAQFDATGTPAYYQYDGIGNTTAMTDAIGAVVNRYTYDPFGRVLDRIEALDNPFLFGGFYGVEEARGETYFMRARFYDAESGRFHSVDPLGFAGGSNNLYTYAGNSPLALSDPSGEWGFIGAIAGAVVGVALAYAGAGGKPTWGQIAQGAIGGAVVGATIGIVGGFSAFAALPATTQVAVNLGAVAGGAVFKAGADILTGDFQKGSVIEDSIDAAIDVGLSVIPGSGAVPADTKKQAAKLAHKGGKFLIEVTKEFVTDQAKGAAADKIKDAVNSSKDGDPQGNQNATTQTGQAASNNATQGPTAQSTGVTAQDPNDIIGPAGVGPQNFVRGDVRLPYTIRFENVATATAPAQEIVITQTLDPDLDPNTVNLGNIVLGDQTIVVPAGRLFFETELDRTADLGLIIAITAEVDTGTGVITWRHRGIDPLTRDLPNDALKGILPPNVVPGEGEGSVSYTVIPRAEAGTGTVIEAEASIVFDLNPAIVTPRVSNTIDRTPPTATVAPLSDVSGRSIRVAWNGTDAGSGVSTFDVAVSTNGGPFVPLLTNTALTSTAFVGEHGKTYSFAVAARDAVGNQQPNSTLSDPVTVDFTTPAREFAVGGGSGGTVVFYDQNGVEQRRGPAIPGFTGGVRTAAADFNGDGIADIVVGTGPGAPTRVRVLDGKTGAELFAVNPFEARFTGGVFVTAGDLTGDGIPELVISPDEGGGPRVQVYRGTDFAKIADFFGIDDPNFRGGARTGVGDINGDGIGDLIVAAGFGGGPRVAVYNGQTLTTTLGKLFNDRFVFEERLRNGAFVSGGDLDGDGFAELIAGAGPGGGPRVLALSGADLLNGQERMVANFFAGDPENRAGIRVVTKDLNGDNRADLLVGDATGSRITGYSGASFAGGGAPELFGFDVFPGFAGGVFVG